MSAELHKTHTHIHIQKQSERVYKHAICETPNVMVIICLPQHTNIEKEYNRHETQHQRNY